MTSREDKLWTKASGELRRSLGLNPLSREEAERFYAEAKGSDLDEATIDRIVSSVRGENSPVTTSLPEVWMAEEEAGAVSEGVLQLNRNAGECSPEVEALLEKRRREALGEDDDDEEDEA